MAIQDDLLQLEEELKKLIIEYEKYFIGVEKREPLKQLADVERLIRKYMGIPINNTMMKFKYNTLVARLSTYKQSWNKINILIENGKYSRDRYKMGLHQKLPVLPQSEPEFGNEPNDEMTRLHRQYMEARKFCNLADKEIPVDTIRNLVEKQKPLIMAKHNCSSIEFKVVIEDGAPKIKAIPRS
jgi:hypothetical protein